MVCQKCDASITTRAAVRTKLRAPECPPIWLHPQEREAGVPVVATPVRRSTGGTEPPSPRTSSTSWRGPSRNLTTQMCTVVRNWLWRWTYQRCGYRYDSSHVDTVDMYEFWYDSDEYMRAGFLMFCSKFAGGAWIIGSQLIPNVCTHINQKVTLRMRHMFNKTG